VKACPRSKNRSHNGSIKPFIFSPHDVIPLRYNLFLELLHNTIIAEYNWILHKIAIFLRQENRNSAFLQAGKKLP
jgi:hypothetical protein